MPYKPNYNNLAQVPNTMTPTGVTSRKCAEIEERSQKAIADSIDWLIARKLNMGGDSQKELENIGFKVINIVDNLFFKVIPPIGWTKSTSGYWTNIYDETGKNIIDQFYKGAFYDRDAFINIIERSD